MGLRLDTVGNVPSVTPDQTATLERISLDYTLSLVSRPTDEYSTVYARVESDSEHAAATLTIWPDGLTCFTCEDQARTRLTVPSLLFALSMRPAGTPDIGAELVAALGNDVTATTTPGVYRVTGGYVAAVTDDGRVRVSAEGTTRNAVTVYVEDAVKLFRLFGTVTNP